MDAVDRAIAEIEELAGRDIQRRNIGPLAAHVRGNLAAGLFAGREKSEELKFGVTERCHGASLDFLDQL